MPDAPDRPPAPASVQPFSLKDGFDYGAPPPAEPAEPAPGPSTAQRVPAEPARPARPAQARKSTPKTPVRAAAGEVRVKDPGVISPSLLVELEDARTDWERAHRAELVRRGIGKPTASGFREALLRIGLQHLEDQVFMDLIPPDGRRRTKS